MYGAAFQQAYWVQLEAVHMADRWVLPVYPTKGSGKAVPQEPPSTALLFTAVEPHATQGFQNC